MILISKYIVPKGYVGLTIFPFVFIKHSHLKTDSPFINHERIHLKQQLELFIILFFLWYGIEFFIRLLAYNNWNKAYKNISFEREAYVHEKDLDYLQSRPLWNFINYIKI